MKVELRNDPGCDGMSVVINAPALTDEVKALAARLHGTRQALEALQEQGVEQIQFVTTLKTTTLSVEDLLAEGGSWFALEHDGLVSRQLSAAQAESLKCQMR